MSKKQIQIGSLSRAFGFIPNSLKPEERAIDFIWTTGERVLRNDFFDGPFYEELEVSEKAIRMDRLNNGAPLLNTHQQDDLNKLMGSMVRAWIDKGVGYGTAKISKRADVEPYFQDIKDGNIRNVSVGYRVYSMTLVGDDNGVPIYRATDWEPLEVSLVPVGADAFAGVRADDAKNTLTIESAEAQGEIKMDEPALAPQEQVIAQDEIKAEEISAKEEPKTEEVKVEQPVEEVRTATESSSKNVLDVLSAVRAAGLSVEVAEKFIKEKKQIEQVRKEIIDMVSTKENIAPHIEAGRDQSETITRGIENALAHRLNPKNELTDLGRQYRGMTVLRMAEEILGSKARGMSKMALARAVLVSSAFPNLMENIAQKQVIDSFKTAPSTFEAWTKKGTLVDFKQASRLMNSGAPNLALLSEGATITEGSMTDSRKEYNQLATYAKNVVLSTQAIINDDLGHFDDVLKLFAISAKRTESSLVYTTTLVGNPNMADSVALFHADHGNTATAAALSIDALETAFIAMQSQMTIDGNDYADIMPKFLIVGLALEKEAKQILGAYQPAQASNVNPYAGALNLIIDPRVTGNKYFLAADPAINPLVEVSHLEGQEGPMVIQEQSTSVDGIIYSCRHYVGVKALDWRAGYYNAGV